MNSKRRLSLTSSAHKLKLDSVNKIIKLDRSGKKQKRETINRQCSRIALAELIKNTPTTQPHQPPDFKTFLSHQDNIRVFKEFLQTQYCQENLDFYLACERYRHLDSNGVGKELVKFMATQIYNDHLSENARQPVNVNNACVQIIKDNLKDPKPDLLCDAQAEIFELMRTDCYPRFCKTWQLEREFAQKILSQTPQTNKDKSTCMVSFTSDQNTNTANILASSLISTPSTAPSRRTSPRLSARSKDISQSSNSTSDCPPECPYFRIGRLPCQGHGRSKPKEPTRDQRRQSRCVTHMDRFVDLKSIHRPPTVCTLNNGLPSALLSSPPPPPLPPKPDNIDFNQIGNNKYCPYVGRVFNV
uniref:Regulator of G-protein signaling loco n=1 Tax=Aceria tosichella TaxID=561515 RepID=A0A6G1SGB7_9ACAR